jgi:uncharacterized GH25 family protein
MIRSLFVFVLAAAGLTAHFTWINPLSSPLQPGAEVQIQLAHGHSFPESEEMLRPDGIEAFAVGPDGARTPIKPARGTQKLVASYRVPSAGFYRFVFVQDRGVMSRTPQGLKAGGRDKNPGAISSARYYRSGIAYALTPGAAAPAAKPLGLEFELVAVRESAGLKISVWQNGKPCPGAEIVMKTPGAPDRKLGVTGADGALTANPGGSKGPVLIDARKTGQASGTGYDSVNLASSLYMELN